MARRMAWAQSIVSLDLSDAGLFVPTCVIGGVQYMTIGSHIGGSTMKELQLKDAKATLSAVVDQAVAGEPTVITRHGRKEAVVVSFQEWERVSRVPSFADLLLAFPGEPGDFPERSRKPARALRDAGR
jgi:antitoxin Phd